MQQITLINEILFLHNVFTSVLYKHVNVSVITDHIYLHFECWKGLIANLIASSANFAHKQIDIFILPSWKMINFITSRKCHDNPSA